MKPILITVSLAILSSLSISAGAQSGIGASLFSGEEGAVSPASPATLPSFRPFSGVALSATVSPLGAGAEISTNLNPHLNLRTTGSMFGYATTFNTNGFAADARLELASVRTSLDVYPFHKGFRISPGVLFYNQNRVTASDTVASGTSFTLNGDTFYSAQANAVSGAAPVNGTALLDLHRTRPAFAITAGWGNPFTRNGHWSFPVEVGVGLVGPPALNVRLNGWACYDQAQTECVNVTDPNNPIAIQVQSDLHSQVDKWNQDLVPLKTYPIVSAGVAYRFHIGRN